MTVISVFGNSNCSNCLKPLDAHRSVGGDAIPEEGSVTICSHCAQLCVYDEELKIRAMTEEEKNEMQKYQPLHWKMLKSIEKLILIKNKMK